MFVLVKPKDFENQTRSFPDRLFRNDAGIFYEQLPVAANRNSTLPLTWLQLYLPGTLIKAMPEFQRGQAGFVFKQFVE